jgi:parallel beta-helix repeat protein
MFRRTVSAIMLTLLMISMLTLAFNIQPVKASGTIYIRADGSIDPPTAPIQRDGNVYALTGNIISDTNGIVVEKDDITLDGGGYTIQGTSGSSRGIDLSYGTNVTIKNAWVTGFWQAGIYLWYSSDICIFNSDVTANYYGGIIGYESNCSNIYENNFENNSYGIYLYGHHYLNRIFGNNITANRIHGIGLDQGTGISPLNNDVYGNNITANYGEMSVGFYGGIFLRGRSNNTIHENNIVANWCGIHLYDGSNNTIFDNNFIANVQQVRDAISDYQVPPGTPSINTWDDGYASGGNYWSNYTGIDQKSGPNQDQPGSDGIGDTPHTIYTNNTDEYPSMIPLNGYRWAWGDDDNDGILNYLDLPSFSFDESSAPSETVLGSVSLPIKITHLLPSSDYGHMMEALHEWGVKETPIQRLMYPIVVDVSNVYGALNWLRTNVPQLVSESFLNQARNSLCADGHWRSLWIIRSNLDAFETSKAILELAKLTLYPDLAFDAITRIINLFDLEVYILGGTGSVTASLSFDFASFSRELASLRKYVKEFYISAFEAIGITLTAVRTGGLAGIALTLVAKLFNLILDYFVFDYVQNNVLNLVKVVLKAFDPPGDRVVLQLFDASGQTMLIGHDKISGEDVPTFEGGLYSADNDSAILIVARDNLDYNITVTTTPTTTTTMPYTMIYWDCTANETIVTGGLLDANQSFSTHLNLTNNRLDMSYLLLNASLSNPNPQVGEQVEVSINVTDDEGNTYGDCDVLLSINSETILAQNQGNGFYNATINTLGMAGSYSLTIFTRNPPPGFLQGTVTYPLEVGPHDIVVTEITVSKSVVGQGYYADVNVTFVNEGSFTENFNITLYADTTMIEITEVALTSETITTITCTWNTTGFSKGNYTVWAHAEPVPGEADTADNNFTGGWVVVAGVGDLTGGTPNAWDFVPDGKVDIVDVAVVAKCFGQKVPPAPANCDVSGTTIGVPDGKIDITDVATVAKHFGEHYSYS